MYINLVFSTNIAIPNSDSKRQCRIHNIGLLISQFIRLHTRYTLGNADDLQAIEQLLEVSNKLQNVSQYA